MPSLTYFVAITLDGFVCAPDGSFDLFPVGQPDNTAYHVDEYPELVPTAARTHLGIEAPNRHFDTMLQGRGSYEVALREGTTSPYGHMREIVFSRTLPADVDANVTVVAGDPIEAVRTLKAEDGPLGICLVGGPTIAAALLPEIDAMLLKRYAVVAGAGKPLFDGASFAPSTFTRVESTTFHDGSDYTLYRRSDSLD